MTSRKAIAVLCVLAVILGCLTGCSKTAEKGKMAYTPPDPPHHTVAEEIIAAHENYVSTPIQPDENGLYTYVFTPEICRAIFYKAPADEVEILKNADWLEGQYVSIEVNGEGDLEIVMDEEDRAYWMKWMIDEDMNGVLKAIEKQEKKRATVSEDYKAVVYETTSESSYNVGILLPFITTSAFFMQVNNGVPL